MGDSECSNVAGTLIAAWGQVPSLKPELESFLRTSSKGRGASGEFRASECLHKSRLAIATPCLSRTT